MDAVQKNGDILNRAINKFKSLLKTSEIEVFFIYTFEL